MSLLGTLATIGNIAGTVGTVANAVGAIGNAFGAWGQTGQSQSAGGSTQQGGGQSQSMSKSGTNDEQVMQYLKGAYQYQNTEGARQSHPLLRQCGYLRIVVCIVPEIYAGTDGI
jgi:acyl-homoserine lactone acylase PvdQ